MQSLAHTSQWEMQVDSSHETPLFTYHKECNRTDIKQDLNYLTTKRFGH